MEMIQKGFKDQLAYGVDGERQIAEYLFSKGVSLLPFFQFENANVSPRLYMSNGRDYALPDFLCAKNKRVFFVECKRKTRWVDYKGVVETGFSNYLLEQYKFIQNATNIPVYAVFLMETKDNRNGIFFLDDIYKRGRLWDGLNKVTGAKIEKPIYFWRIEDLIKLKEL